MISITAIDHIVLNVSNLEASALWYERVLGMQRNEQATSTGDIRVSMMFGRQKLNLRPVGTSAETWFTARHPVEGSDDLCFLTEAKPDDVVDHLSHCQVDIELGPVTKSGAQGAICSVYVRDPDGNLVEISSYR